MPLGILFAIFGGKLTRAATIPITENVIRMPNDHVNADRIILAILIGFGILSFILLVPLIAVMMVTG